jgi:trehalose 6-phosphate phosphatase
MDRELKRRLRPSPLSPGIPLEDGVGRWRYTTGCAACGEGDLLAGVPIRADLPNAPIEVMPGKCVWEIKHSGFTKATGVLELMAQNLPGPPSDFYRR